MVLMAAFPDNGIFRIPAIPGIIMCCNNFIRSEQTAIRNHHITPFRKKQDAAVLSFYTGKIGEKMRESFMPSFINFNLSFQIPWARNFFGIINVSSACMKYVSTVLESYNFRIMAFFYNCFGHAIRAGWIFGNAMGDFRFKPSHVAGFFLPATNSNMIFAILSFNWIASPVTPLIVFNSVMDIPGQNTFSTPDAF